MIYLTNLLRSKTCFITLKSQLTLGCCSGTVIDLRRSNEQVSRGELARTHARAHTHKPQENELVKAELDILDDNAPVFKLIGPVLMRQDLDEAKQNVDKRLEFIKGEM